MRQRRYKRTRKKRESETRFQQDQNCAKAMNCDDITKGKSMKGMENKISLRKREKDRKEVKEQRKSRRHKWSARLSSRKEKIQKNRPKQN